MDHNIRTLDRNDNFHGMGMITTVTPGVRSNNRIPSIKVSLRDLAATGRVPIQLGPDICSSILFLHAILGCDTTSQLHGIGKGNSLKKFRDCNHFRDLSIAFNSPSTTAEEIVTAEEQVLVSMYNGKPGETLDYVRYKCFCVKVARNTSHIQPKTLPPISCI